MNRSKMNAEQQKLAADYIPFARTLAERQAAEFPRIRRELHDAAIMGLCEAALSYESGRDIKFATFAAHRIEGEMRDALRRMTPKGYRRKSIQPPKFYSLRGVQVEDGARLADAIDETDAIESLLRKLPTKYAEVCRCVYAGAMNRRETAEHLGRSETRVAYMVRKSLAMLRQDSALQTA